MLIPVYIREGCLNYTNVLACFNLPDNTITVTQLGLTQSDYRLKCTLMHENRHAWQYATGFLNYLEGETFEQWFNRAEADAQAHSC